MITFLWSLATFLFWPFLVLRAKLRPVPKQQRLLVIQWAKMGDLVCTTPFIRAIKEAHPAWELHVLCRKRCEGALRGNPFVDRLLGWSGTRHALISSLRRQRYDVVINCMPDAFTSLFALWTGAVVRINTFSTRRGLLVRLHTLFNTVNVPYRIHTRTFDHYMRLAAALRVPSIPYRLDFFPSTEDQGRVRAWMREQKLSPRSFLCLNVSAGNAVKEWPLRHVIAFIDRVSEEMNLDTVLSTLDRERVQVIRERISHPERTRDGSVLSLGELGALCQSVAAYIAVDTGPLYVAYAAGAPIVAIVGASDPHEQLPPESERVAHVLPSAGCAPWMFVSLTPHAATAEQLCNIRETSVEAVMDGLRRVLRS